MILLASASASRAAMLRAAGVPFEAVAPRVDEAAAKAGMAGASVRDIADALAELKALKVSRSRPGVWVLGSDSMVALDRRAFLDKPGSIDGLVAQLRQLRGREHRLVSAAVVARDGLPVWRHVDEARMRVRAFSEAWLAGYVAACGERVLASVGGYHLEAEGVQLFDAVEGDQFTVRGLPLIAVLAWLREAGVMPR
jgi:septum formation protein